MVKCKEKILHFTSDNAPIEYKEMYGLSEKPLIIIYVEC